jgi:RNA polymerase sigma-70 factor (ECF subfamily)
MMNITVAGSEVLSDESVIQKILEGDTSVFEILIRRYNTVIYRIGRMYGFNHHDTEDLMQDTHVSAYTQLASFEHRASYKTWISRIMINKCIYKLKYGYFKNEIPGEQVYESNSATIQTEQNMLNRELSSVLEKSLESIPVIYRSVFVLREVQGFSVAETAELLGITPVNVKVRLNRAKSLLQKQLEQFYTANEIYSFNLIYCDNIVKRVFDEINKKTLHHPTQGLI